MYLVVVNMYIYDCESRDIFANKILDRDFRHNFLREIFLKTTYIPT